MALEPEGAAQARRWRSPLIGVTLAGLVFSLLSGCVLLFAGAYLERRDYWGMVHWIVALAVMAPYAVYQLRHYLRVRQYVRQTHYRVGLHAFLSMCGTVVTGLALVWPLQRVPGLYGVVDLAHMFFGFVFAILVSAHLTLVALLTVARAPAGEDGVARTAVRRLLWTAALLTFAAFAVALRAGR